MKEKFIIQFSSENSCAGKTTAANLLMEKVSGLYKVSFDKQKWFLSDYQAERDVPLVKKIVAGLFETVCKEGIPIILDFGFFNKNEWEDYAKIAQKYGYRLIHINLIAPREVLLERFRERVRKIEKENTKISVKDEDLFVSNFDIKWYIPEGAINFDTSKTLPEEIVEKIIEQIK